MPNDKLREILESLEASWFFKNISDGSEMNEIKPIDLRELPPKYRKRLDAFISSHSMEELLELETKDFIEQATGESFDKVKKLITIAKKVQSLEQDFN